ncbi:C3HC4 type zinc finger-containing protein [Aspergillus flavus]|uniref:C3HC4 type zinc finger-containing protein n=2 Tax=Aspergillus flavus TaxID=5059 RepID=A0A7U2MK74_ASPFN|nr:hypothetical protein AFLA_009606 [Aspergillus flavus NRRL3357]KAJ1711576.1 hypothetical protein NYO67_6257 [Aspergillus flavus]KOC10443.1 hypothetical protein AFLA70_272g000982 [Aspergillus flavus AF70]QRD84800.1 C3HC4 type zinc finger-containing protein [Aspergillus flavus]RAQ43599.1 C3HC4 type (RING finger) zinc finger containing protein [Aspergillus flavus]
MNRSSSTRGPLPSSSHTIQASHPRRRRPSDPAESSETQGEGRKRRRLSSSNVATRSAQSALDHHDDDIESIDLTEVEGPSALAKVLAKQREDAVRAQESVEPEKGQSILNSYKCPVCMDTPEDATSTICGHLFCHKCIIDTLKFSEEQRADTSSKGPRGTCPVCRKPLARNDAPGSKRNLVPLQLKLVTKKRNTTVPSSG